MGIFDAIKVAEGAMSVHRFRSEIAAENIANAYGNPNYQRKEVILQPGHLGAAVRGVQAGTGAGVGFSGGMTDAETGAVRVAGIRRAKGGKDDERQQAYLGVLDMMRSKSAFDLNVKAATLLKSMALSSLEIGRGG